MTEHSGFARLSNLEAMLSVPIGSTDPGPMPDPGVGARAALEGVVRPLLAGGPTHVLFSGGRDSSAVLAVAVHVARSMGLPDPIPVTATYPGHAGADESEWQDLVLRHLRLRERIVVPIADQRHMLGAVSTANLERRGLVWPAGVQSQPVLLDGLAGSAVLTGEGGDGFLAARRVTPLLILKQSRTRPGRALRRALVDAVEPGVVQRRRQWRAWRSSPAGWLRPGADRILFDSTVRPRPPLRWDTETWGILSMRHVYVAMHNSAAGAADVGVNMRHPLADPHFVAALAREGGRWGFRGRTHVFRHLVGDLLPEAVVSRSTKAHFNGTRWGHRERDFARTWDGSGVDPELVDPAALRAEWMKESPSPAATFLIHAAWLSRQGLGWNGTTS